MRLAQPSQPALPSTHPCLSPLRPRVPVATTLRPNADHAGHCRYDRAREFEEGQLSSERRRLGTPWSTPQRAFFIPLAHVAATWEWTKENQGAARPASAPHHPCERPLGRLPAATATRDPARR